MAQCARIGVAVTDLYPRFSIAGSIGVEGQNLGELFQSGSFNGFIGPGFRWNVLNYGRLESNVEAQEALFQQLAYDYQESVIQAQREVEDAVIGLEKAQEQVRALVRGVESARDAVQTGSIQYRGGLVDFNRVFLLQTELVVQQDQLAVARGDRALNLIAIYRALGGGWQIRLPDEALPQG